MNSKNQSKNLFHLPFRFKMRIPFILASFILLGHTLFAGESPYLYGIFDPEATEYLNHISSGAGPGWVTATVQVGSDTNNFVPNADFTSVANQGHTVICRINNGYFPNGTIPLTNNYDAFATCCSNFVAHSPGCSIWTIGNELNISGEWPYDPALGKAPYVTPANYATCFRKVYNAIKAVHPNDKILPAAPACFTPAYSAGSNPYGTNNYPYDANPLNWVQTLNQMLTAIKNTGPLDGIALHVSSRGYTCDAIHSTQQVSASGQNLYFSFYVYKDWVNLGIPASLYNLPLYATECNGYFYWKGGHPEDPFQHYEAGWMQEVYAEMNRYNQSAMATGKPVFHCFNMYRWCGACDGWNIDGGDNVYKSQILSDLDEAVAKKYTWPTSYASLLAPIGINFIDPGGNDAVAVCDPAGVVPQNSWNNMTPGAGPATNNLDGGITVTWSSPGGGSHTLATQSTSPADYALMRDYLDTSDTSQNTATVSGLKFPLYDVIVYSDGDNGSAVRVGKYTLSGATSGNAIKYVKDNGVDFSGSYTEVDNTTGGINTPAGNYCRFRNVRGGSFTITGKGDYASDNHPRGPFNALQIVPVYSVATLTNLTYSGSQAQFSLNGAANANYIVQSSTNLTNWASIRTNAAPAQITDPSPPPARRFYRALLQ